MPAPDGRGHSISRLLRRDDRPDGSPRVLGEAVSGRVFVAAAVLGILAAWGLLYLAFVAWRSGVRDRIAFGKEHVAPAVRPLAEAAPPDISPEDWRAAVAATEAMLVEVIGTGRLDRPALESLRVDLTGRVASARRRPDFAPAVLAKLWDDMSRLAPLPDNVERPEFLPAPKRSKRAGEITR